MATQSLVVSRDLSLVGALRPLMAEIGMDAVVVSELSTAIDSFQKHKFDALFVDCDQDKDGFELLMRVREQHPEHKVVAVGITADPAAMQAVFDSGATFVLGRPLPLEDARRILRISKGAATRAVRRFLRLPVNTLSIASLDDKQEAVILNISQRGMAIQCTEVLSPGQMVYASFLLPETFTLVEGMAQVMWVDPSGRAGIEFRTLTDEGQLEVSHWIYERAKKEDPWLEPPPLLQPSPQPEPRIEVTHLHELTPEKLRSVSAVLLGMLVDVMVVAGGASLFFGFAVMAGNPVWHWTTIALGLTAGVVLWMVYRFLFSFFHVESPGRKTTQMLVEEARKHEEASSAGHRANSIYAIH